MIRDATEADIPALLEMGERFAATVKITQTVGYCRDSVAALFRQLIETPTGILLIADGGAAGGLVHPSAFNAAHMTGSELFWWVDPQHRGTGLKLFDALEEAARDRGAQSWMVSTMEALNFDGAAKFYARKGYVPSDRNFIKVL